jgi:hypothetical protein
MATNTKKESKQAIILDRRSGERRDGNAAALDMGVMKQPRRKTNRRRHIDPTTCEREYNEQEIQFMRAMDDYKRKAGRMFPTCSEVLEVLASLGYRQLSDAQIEELGLQNVSSDSQDTEDCDEEVEGDE